MIIPKLKQILRARIRCSLFIFLSVVCLYIVSQDKQESQTAKAAFIRPLVIKAESAGTHKANKTSQVHHITPGKGPKIDMIRDIAKKIIWSADQIFETDLMAKCEARQYDLSVLPKASVVLCFHGQESFTRLIHTVHSIVQNSPSELLKEIILIADNSKAESHKEPLEHYAQFVFPELIRILRSDEQLGLIRCRQMGATHAQGDMVVMLDSHMEARTGWLEALSYEIHKNPKTMASPYLDWMDQQEDETWVYEYGCSRYKTVWYWKDMTFTFMEIPNELKYIIDSTEAIISPITVGVWSISKQFFMEIGGLDTGMKLWGGENIDLAIRVVLAGGRHVNVPCAHVGHCAPQGSRDYRVGHKPEVNYKRIVETIFDQQYKDTIYYYNPSWKDIDAGDITDRLLLKEHFQHNFTYYMTHHDQEHLAPNINTLAWDGGLFLTNDGELHSSNHIITSYLVDDSLSIGNYVGVINTTRVDRWMHKRDSTIQWYPHPEREGHTVKNKVSECITAVRQANITTAPYKVSLRPCNKHDPFQQWTFGIYTEDYEQLQKNQIVPKHLRSDDARTFYNKYLRYLRSV